MVRFSANISMLFTEADFLDRFRLAAEAGFKAVEYMFPYQWEKEELRERLTASGLEQVLFNLPAGDWSGGERGIACLPGREGEFRDGVAQAIKYAHALGCPRVNCLAGLAPSCHPDRIHETLVHNLRFAADELAKEGIQLLVEPLNNQDIPGFYLCGSQSGLSLIEEVGSPNLRLQYDIYHMQVTEGNLLKTIGDHLGTIAHIQIADNPGRNEPGTGEINYPNIFRFLEEHGYAGWIGCEYRPLRKTAEGLDWLKPYM
jgi:hydroxypyruvate isomerase